MTGIFLPLLTIFCQDRIFHEMGLDVFVDKKIVRIESFYTDGGFPKDAVVMVMDHAEKEIAKGKTNGKGEWSFSRPKPGKYLIQLDAGQGHKLKVQFLVPDPAKGDK